MTEASPLSGGTHRPIRSAGSLASRASIVQLLFALNLALIIVLWFTSSGFEMNRSSADFWNGVGRITGLIGTYLVLWQLLLMARIRWFEIALGLERMAVLHRLNGYAALLALVAHGVFQTVGYMLGDGRSVTGQLADFITSYQGVLAAIVSLALLVGIVVVSITIVRRRLAYETWYYVHLYAYIAVAIAFSHQLATGNDFVNNPLFVSYWILLYLAVIGALLYYRLARPLLAYRRHRFYVQSVAREAPGVVSIRIGGRDLEAFPADAGQFAMWRFLDRRRWWQAHPFSLSAVPDGRSLRLTVKDVGDFSGALLTLKPGTPVLIEGPFGKFTERPDNRRALLIAGGIGITPIRPLAQAMVEDGYNVRVLYRARDRASMVFANELSTLSQAHGLQVDALLSDDPNMPSDGWFVPAAITRMVPDAPDRMVYLCGPPGMMEAATSGLRAIGVPGKNIRTEVFRLQ